MFIYLVIYFSSIFCFGLFLIYNHDRASTGKCNILSAFSRFGDVINPSIFSQSSVLCLPQCSMYPFSVFFFFVLFVFALLDANINYFLYVFSTFPHLCSTSAPLQPPTASLHPTSPQQKPN